MIRSSSFHVQDYLNILVSIDCKCYHLKLYIARNIKYITTECMGLG